MILIAYGTRPEYIKLKSIMHEFDSNNIKYITLFTGQHKDLLKEKKADYHIDIIDDNNNRLDNIVKSIMSIFSNILEDIDYVLVQGDTTSVLAVALSAFHHRIKVIHLEAGLRTYDNSNPYPEEQNRRLVSQITDIHLCPTFNAVKVLNNERIGGLKYDVGNTVLDNLLPYKKDCEYKNKILITMHRRENHVEMEKWFKELEKIAEHYIAYEFILPLHPNPNVQKYKEMFKYVKVVEPMSHDKLLKLLVKTRLVITDSGGIQEECSFFNKKCLTCRKVTERPEAIGQSTFMIDKPEDLFDTFQTHINDYEINYNSPFGDGHSAERICKILREK